VYLTTLSEPSLKLMQYMQQFSYFDPKLIEQAIVFADIGSVIRSKGPEATLSEISDRVEREEPAVVVIDSFKAIRDILSDATALRTFVYDLAVHTASWGAASLLVGEYTQADSAKHAEFAIADGIIRFTNSRHELTAVREVEVLKLRGADYVTGGHFFEIGSDGLTFFPRVRSPDGSAAESGHWQASRRRWRTGSRQESPGSTPCSKAGCPARARPSSRVERARERPCSVSSSSSRARSMANRVSTSCSRKLQTSFVRDSHDALLEKGGGREEESAAVGRCEAEGAGPFAARSALVSHRRHRRICWRPGSFSSSPGSSAPRHRHGLRPRAAPRPAP
jgi:KaiC/GvpD/RAD55 family RecA-like ATPase